jgi:hypothetical protein
MTGVKAQSLQLYITVFYFHGGSGFKFQVSSFSPLPLGGSGVGFTRTC